MMINRSGSRIGGYGGGGRILLKLISERRNDYQLGDVQLQKKNIILLQT